MLDRGIIFHPIPLSPDPKIPLSNIPLSGRHSMRFEWIGGAIHDHGSCDRARASFARCVVRGDRHRRPSGGPAFQTR